MTNPTLVVLIVLAGAATLVVGVAAARHPPARRLGARSARRRPTEAMLVILGALLGTAIITGSLLVGEALSDSLRSRAFTQLGPVDETVTAPGADSLPSLRESLSNLEATSSAVDGVALGLRSSGTAAADVSGDPSVQPDVLLLELAFEEARALGTDPSATGFEGSSTPEPGGVAVSADLAGALDVDAGDDLRVFAYGQRRNLTVSAVLPRRGVAGYSTDLAARSFNVFLPPGTIERLASGTSQAVTGSPPVALALVSNTGDVLSGVERTDHVTDLLEQRLRGMERASVTESKQDVLDTADEISAGLTEIFLGIGAFAVIAGILLLVNVFVMLAQERRSELGIMRAVGMQRTELIRAFFLEGALYSAAAAVLGALAGIGVGAAIIQVARGISGGPAGLTLDLRFTVDAGSVVTGMLIGLLIALATVLATSVRISRLNIIRALRELPESRRASRRTLVVAGWLTTLGGAALTAGALGGESGSGLFLGPALLAVGLVALLRPLLGRGPAITILGLALVAWGITAPTVVPEAFRGAAVLVFVLQGLVVTGAAVVVLAHNQAAVGRLVRGGAGRSGNLTARLGLAYPLARPFRTTMTLAMYALIVFMLVLVSLLAQVVGSQTEVFADAESGGYDLLVTSAETNPIPPASVRHLQGVETVAPLRHAAFSVEFRTPGHEEFRRWFASGYDRHLLRTRPPTLDRWLPRLPDQRSVWDHVLDQPSAMIVGAQFLQEAGAPQTVRLGDVVEVRDPITGDQGKREVVGIMEGGLAFSGALMSEDSITSVLGRRVPTNRLYVELDGTTAAGEVADRLEEEHIRHGVEARTFREIVAQRQQQNRQFIRILQGYLMLGLLVGSAGLGVVMVRAVRERRQQIGLLRSIGLQPETVGRSFMLEAAFIALQGMLIGTALGAATAYQLIDNAAAFGGLDVRFQVPWIEIAVLLGVTLLASIAAAGWPARRASGIRPAVALRTVE